VTAAVIAAVGLVVGSFLNVVIARLPAGRSVVGGRSACPACGAVIAWHDNIPVLSFAMLRGRCRHCAVRISWRYPIVEVVTAALFVGAYLKFGVGIDLVAACLLLAALVALTAIDLDHQLLPDAITLPGILTGVAANVASPNGSLIDSLIGIAVGSGIFLVIILASGGGMGGGDMKLGAMLGAFMGWKVALVALFLGVVAGGLGAVLFLATGRKGRKDPIPFGPFLAVGGAVAMFWGQALINWYLDGFLR
jgi:leader peptidase (prepilin peptidase)/N-methyltransferase